MSIIEKAAEKLQTLRPAPEGAASPVSAAAPGALDLPGGRLQDGNHSPDAAPVEPTCHVDMAAVRRVDAGQAEWRLLEELRRVKRPLLDNAAGKGSRTIAHAERIVVTSALPEDGKTFTAVNLALSFAHEPDFEVVLVDGDPMKADVTRSFALEGRLGLVDVLADEALDPARAIVRTDVPNLWAVPAGKRDRLTAELFGGRRMDYVLDVLTRSRRPRLLLFDSPPLLALAGARVLASHMGQVVVVVAAGHTRQQDLRVALECVNPEQYVGLILNKSNLPASELQYYGGYYSQYSGRDS